MCTCSVDSNDACTITEDWITWLTYRIMNNGERVTRLYPNDSYFAHLSIYSFAVDYCRGCHVPNAGCGAGMDLLT